MAKPTLRILLKRANARIDAVDEALLASDLVAAEAATDLLAATVVAIKSALADRRSELADRRTS